MAIGNTTYGDISPRVAAKAAKMFLKRGMPYLCLEKFGQAETMPSNESKVLIFRRYDKFDATPKALTEGVTPNATKLEKTDVPCTLVQYGDRTTITDVVMDTHEDKVLTQAIEVLGEQAAEMIETMRFGILKAGTNVFYGNDVAGRTDVATAISITDQRRVTRALKRQNARPITKVVRSTPAYGTENVARAYVGLCHPDLESDIRGMTGFTPVEKYGSLSPWDNEIGKVEDVRYVTSTIFAPWADGGAASATMLSTTGTNADVYPVLYVASDAYGIVALKGQFAITPMVVNPKPSDSDPLAQRGHVGWKAMQTAVILNDAWMARLEVAVTK